MKKYIVKVSLPYKGLISKKIKDALIDKKYNLLLTFSKKKNNSSLENITLLTQWANTCNGKILEIKSNYFIYSTNITFEFYNAFDLYIFNSELSLNNVKFKVYKKNIKPHFD